MDLIQESFHRLFPEDNFSYRTYLEYNRRLGDFNANMKMGPGVIKVNLNLQWKDIDEEIKIGLVQHLLLKVFKRKKNSANIELYNNFIKNISLFTPKTNIDPFLEESFARVNDNFFRGNIEKPNLVWGQDSFRKLASYNFHNDTVTVSTLFQDSQKEILDYLIYHELLHKFHQFSQKNGRSSFHSPAFRQDEKLYPSQEKIEQKINEIIRNKRIKSFSLKKRKRGLWRFF